MKQTDQRIFAIPSFSNAFLFLVLTLLWSWTFLVIAILRSEDANIFPTSFLRFLASLGLLIIAIGMMKFRPDGESLHFYWLRLIHWQQIPKWILIGSLLFSPLTALIASITSQLSILSSLSTIHVWKTNANSLSIFWSWILPLFYYSLPEEFGWRGYALPRLQSRWNPFLSSLLLGIVWSLWYLPLYFIPGTYQSHLIFGSTLFWIFILHLISQSILMTAIMNAARGFILPTILFNYTTNLTAEVLQFSTQVTMHWIFWTSCAASLVVIYWLFTKQVHFHRTRVS
ncbi:MAG: CPBP family intramembrane glutamic endopeptidase [Anaerolineales bacterium]